MKIISKEITIKAPVEKVWKHLTDPQKIATWFLPTDFEPKVGKSFTLRCEDQGTVECIVREVVPNEKLVYSFKPLAANVETLVSFVLSQLGEETKLVLTHSGWEALPPEQEDVFQSSEQGWGHFLTRLVEALESEGN
ncbi:MAG: SRPBCC domain-containing protein [Chthoniobacterales bacterium]|jgi:uncharacterized protein YndB with AHSA1/START domain